MTRPCRAFAVTLLVVLGCGGPPEIDRPVLPVSIPDRWSSLEADSPDGGKADEPTAAVRPAWWNDFDEPRLEPLIEEALRHNQDLRAAAARVVASEARARIDGADRFPQIGAQFNAARSRQNFIGLPVPGGSGDVLTSRSTNVGVSFDVSWELDVWGRLRSTAGAALADVEAAQADYEAARLSLAAQTANVWFATVAARRQVELAEATVEAFQTTLDKVMELYLRGLRPSLDARLARSNVATAEASVARRRETLERARRQLEVLLGRYPAGELEAGENLPDVAGPPPAGLPADLVARRPDLVSSERRLAAAGARLEAARAALYPRISLTASGGTSSDELSDLVDLDFSVWRIAANLFQPIFQGGRLIAGVDLSDARQQEALAQYVQLALNAYAEVESSLIAEKQLAERVDALVVASREAIAARDLAEERYENGLDDFTTVLDAQRSAFVLESELLLARRLRIENRIDLHLALGGGFERPDRPPDPALPSENSVP